MKSAPWRSSTNHVHAYVELVKNSLRGSMNSTAFQGRMRRITQPSSWQIRTRRRFLLTLPIALPLWLAALVAVLILVGLRKLAEPVVKFWNDPPKLRYVYHKRPAAPNVVSLETKELKRAA